MIKNIFGEYLKKRRKEADLTLKELAENIRLSHGYISNVENGKMKGNLDLIEGINVVLNIPIVDSIIRLKIDNGELEILETSVESGNINLGYTNLLVDLLMSKPGKYYFLTRRLLSLKTMEEISNESGLTIEKINEIESYGSNDQTVLNLLGRCYGIPNMVDFLLNQTYIAGNDINSLENIINQQQTPITYELETYWRGFANIELSKSQIELEKKYEETYIENFIKESARHKVCLKNDDIHFRLTNLDRAIFKGRTLSVEDRIRAAKILELVFTPEDITNNNK